MRSRNRRIHLVRLTALVLAATAALAACDPEEEQDDPTPDQPEEEVVRLDVTHADSTGHIVGLGANCTEGSTVEVGGTIRGGPAESLQVSAYCGMTQVATIAVVAGQNGEEGSDTATGTQTDNEAGCEVHAIADNSTFEAYCSFSP